MGKSFIPDNPGGTFNSPPARRSRYTTRGIMRRIDWARVYEASLPAEKRRAAETSVNEDDA